MKIGKEMFWETFMPGLTAWLEVVWSATVPWNLRGCISSSFPTSKCCTNSLCRGIFPHIVTCQLLVTRTMLSSRSVFNQWVEQCFCRKSECHYLHLQMRSLGKREAKDLTKFGNAAFFSSLCSVSSVTCPLYFSISTRNKGFLNLILILKLIVLFLRQQICFMGLFFVFKTVIVHEMLHNV